MTDAPLTRAAVFERLTAGAMLLASQPDRLKEIQVFADMWGLDCYAPPPSVQDDVSACVEAALALARCADLGPQPQQEPTPEAVERAAVRVKPLEWEDDTDPFPGSKERWRARDCFGDHYEAELIDGLYAVSHKALMGDLDCPSLAEAQAAAQADYEARILSALTVPA